MLDNLYDYNPLGNNQSNFCKKLSSDRSLDNNSTATAPIQDSLMAIDQPEEKQLMISGKPFKT
jgi:hypothetical protein